MSDAAEKHSKAAQEFHGADKEWQGLSISAIAESPLRKNEVLMHRGFYATGDAANLVGLVQYKSKVRNHPELIVVVRYGEDNLEQHKEKRIKVDIRDCSRIGKKAGRMQGSRLILAHCTCGLKVRASAVTFEKGDILCFNAQEKCPNFGKPMEIEYKSDREILAEALLAGDTETAAEVAAATGEKVAEDLEDYYAKNEKIRQRDMDDLAGD